MREIDFTKDSWEATAEPYQNYGKFSGLALARKHDLPTTERVWIYGQESATAEHENMPTGEKLICRPDAPMGKGNNLPRGRDLYPEDIPGFYKSLSGQVDAPSILIMRNPGSEVLEAYIPRYQVSGAAMAVVSPKKQIYLEYVGPGFDVGELTRGKDVHTSLSIPWEAITEKPYQIMRFNRLGILGSRRDISSEEFALARERRIAELKALGEFDKSIEDEIPLTPTKLSSQMFRWIYQRCIMNTLFSSHPALSNDFGIMMNIYSTRLYVFEIWLPKRSSLGAKS